MTPETTKEYLTMAAMLASYDIDTRGVDIISVRIMRRILKRLILRGTYIQCELCGQMITNERELSLDHIVPRSRGGSDYLHNMQPAHRKCNELKGNAISQEDISAACASADDSPAEILQRKKKRKCANQKERKVVRIKPWQVDKFNTR